MKDENSMPTAQKMTDVSLSIFRSKFKKTRIQMIDYSGPRIRWSGGRCGVMRGKMHWSHRTCRLWRSLRRP